MGCLFGYCGPPAPGLLEAMAQRLVHRCHSGWEKTQLTLKNNETVEVGHGISSWQSHSQVAATQQTLLAYAGVLFNLPADSITPLPQHIDEIKNTFTGAFTLAYAAAGADKQKPGFYLLRDHAGIKVIYWTICQNRLLFASEIKALFADTAMPRRLRPGALLEYLSFSFVPGSATMFENIHELQPGTLLGYQDGQVTLKRHFQFEQQEADVVQSEPSLDFVTATRSALETSVQECCESVAATPGIFISGGLDSSSVLAVACRQQSAQKLPTFSVHFGAEYPNENEFIRLITERYQTEHHWLEIRPEQFLPKLREVIWRLDDPIGDPVALPNYLMAQAAARITPLILNGEGGDPCLGGPKNIPMLLTQLYGPAPQESSVNWLEQQYLRSFQRCYEDLQQLIDPDILRQAGGIESLETILQPFFQTARPRHFLNQLMATNIRLKGANLILVKVDKMTSAHDVLALAPLFSKRIIELSMACPVSLKLVGSSEKYILKQAVKDIVPEAIINRPKSGMRVPVSFWLRGELRQYAEHLLSKPALQQTGLFQPDYVRRLLDFERAGVPGQRHGLKLWMLITFALWYEQMIENVR